MYLCKSLMVNEPRTKITNVNKKIIPFVFFDRSARTLCLEQTIRTNANNEN